MQAHDGVGLPAGDEAQFGEAVFALDEAVAAFVEALADGGDGEGGYTQAGFDEARAGGNR